MNAAANVKSPSGNAVPGLSDLHRTHFTDGISSRNICPRTDASMKYSSAASDFDAAQDMQHDRDFDHCFSTNAVFGKFVLHTLHGFEFFFEEGEWAAPEEDEEEEEERDAGESLDTLSAFFFDFVFFYFFISL